MNNKPQAIADKDYVYGAISIIREIFDTPIHVHCLMALTVFRLGRLHSGCVFCCKRSFVFVCFSDYFQYVHIKPQSKPVTKINPYSQRV